MEQTIKGRGVLLAIPWSLKHVGGVNEVVKGLLERLGRDTLWHGDLMVCSEDRDEAFDRNQKFATHYLPLPGPLEGHTPGRALVSFLLRLPQRLAQLRELCDSRAIACINVHYPNPGALHFVLLRAMGWWRGGLVLSFHLSDAVGAAATQGLERWLWKRLLKAADAIVVPSSDLGHHLTAITPACAAKIHSIPNGVDLELFEKPQDLPERWPVELTGRRVVVSVGNFEPRKGHALVLEAVARLRQQYPDLGLLILGGDRPYRSELEELRERLGLAGHAFFFSGIAHDLLPGYLQRGHVFALATESETFCLAILEAGAAGLAVVSTQVPGVVEVIENGVTGQLVEHGNGKAIEEALRKVLDKQPEVDRMKRQFRERIASGLTLDHQFESYQKIYEQTSVAPGSLP